MTPKAFARLARFRHAERLLRSPGHRSLASIALTCGYCDQAHLNRDFRDLAGCPPPHPPTPPRRATAPPAPSHPSTAPSAPWPDAPPPPTSHICAATPQRRTWPPDEPSGRPSG